MEPFLLLIHLLTSFKSLPILPKNYSPLAFPQQSVRITVALTFPFSAPWAAAVVIHTR